MEINRLYYFKDCNQYNRFMGMSYSSMTTKDRLMFNSIGCKEYFSMSQKDFNWLIDKEVIVVAPRLAQVLYES